MQDKYVDMQDSYVNMQHNYVDMQENCNQMRIITSSKKSQLSPTCDIQDGRYATYWCQHATYLC